MPLCLKLNIRPPSFYLFVLVFSHRSNPPATMALSAAVFCTPVSHFLPRLAIRPPTHRRRFSPSLASLSSSSHESSPSSPAETVYSANPASKPVVESSRPLNPTLNYALPDSPHAASVVRLVRSSESSIERVSSRIIHFS